MLSCGGGTTSPFNPGLSHAWGRCHWSFDDVFVGAWCTAMTSHAGLTVLHVFACRALILRGRCAAARAPYSRLEDLDRWLVERDVASRSLDISLFVIVIIIFIIVLMSSLKPFLSASLCCNATGSITLR